MACNVFVCVCVCVCVCVTLTARLKKEMNKAKQHHVSFHKEVAQKQAIIALVVIIGVAIYIRNKRRRRC